MTNLYERIKKQSEKSALDWLESSARVLYEAPIDQSKIAEGLRERIRLAYLSGYIAGAKTENLEAQK